MIRNPRASASLPPLRIFALGFLCTWQLLVPLPAPCQPKDSTQASVETQGSGKISGHIYRSDTGEPISKAEVTLNFEGQEMKAGGEGSRIVRTGLDGAFEFSDLPPGPYGIRAWRNGFAVSRTLWEQNVSHLTLASGQEVRNIELKLSPAGTISGTVTDEDQEPVEGVTVYILRVDYQPGGGRLLYPTTYTTTNDQGVFRVANLPPGTYYARSGGFLQRPHEQAPLKQNAGGGVQYRETYYPGAPQLDEAEAIEVRPGQEARDIGIPLATERTYSITGAVVGVPKSVSLKPTEIHVTARGAATQMWGNGGMPLNADGSYTLRMLPPGDYTLTAIAYTHVKKNEISQEVYEGFASVHVANSNVRADIQAGRAGRVRGKVQAPDGFSFAGKSVALQTEGITYFPAPVDSAGMFEVRNVPPGNYTFALQECKSQGRPAYLKQVSCSGTDYTTQPVEIGLDATLNCELTAADDSSVITGEVKDGDAPAAGLVVVLIPESRDVRRNPRYTLTAKTDSGGSFRMPAVIPGEYMLFAVAPSEDHVYFALDFADRHQQLAVRVKVAARTTQVVNLKPSMRE